MSGKRYSEEFRAEVVRLVTEDKQAVPAIAAKLGITTHSLYAWLKNQDITLLPSLTQKSAGLKEHSNV